jgi:hypothetical protein
VGRSTTIIKVDFCFDRKYQSVSLGCRLSERKKNSTLNSLFFSIAPKSAL